MTGIAILGVLYLALSFNNQWVFSRYRAAPRLWPRKKRGAQLERWCWAPLRCHAELSASMSCRLF